MSDALPKTCNIDALSVTGPFPQTLFLGCSIVSFTANVGWNEQTTEITVQLVEDSCPISRPDIYKTYYDEKCTAKQWRLPDPGFVGLYKDIIGCPVYFRIAEFEFAGIVQSWEESFSFSGNPTYTVVIHDPRQLLENSSVIIGGYAGNVGGLSNIFNVFGFLENLMSPYGTSVSAPQLSLVNGAYVLNAGYVAGVQTGTDWPPDGATFGSPAQAYGNSEVNSNGILWSKLILGVNLLINSTPALKNIWSPHGRMTYRAVNDVQYKTLNKIDNTDIPRESSVKPSIPQVWVPIDMKGCGLIINDGYELIDSVLGGIDYYNEYFVDLSDLPAPPDYWRIAGTLITLKDVVAQICEATGYDYYIELIYVPDVMSPSGISKFIKVRTVRRLLQPTIGTIASLIGEGSNTASANRGVELRNEKNSSILIGGKKETLYQMVNPYVIDDENSATTIYPYFGIDPLTENVIVPYKDSNPANLLGDRWAIVVDAATINNQLNRLDPIGTVASDGKSYAYISEYEMMAAIGGFDMWVSAATSLGKFHYSSTGESILKSDTVGLFDVYALCEKIKAAAAPPPPPAEGEPPRPVDNPIFPSHFITRRNKAQFDKAKSRDWEELQLIYQWIKSFADNLGKKFMLMVPWTAGRQDTEALKVITSESPTSAGWTEQPTVLDLPTNSVYTIPLRDEDNKLSAMIVLDDNIEDEGVVIPKDISYLGDTYGIVGGKIYIRATVDSEFVYGDKYNLSQPLAVLTIAGPVPVMDKNDKYPQDCYGLYSLMEIVLKLGGDAAKFEDAKNILKAQDHNVGGKILNLQMPYYFDTAPYGATCGLKSDIMTYGPWFKAGPIGGTKIEHDEDLVPWNYGGYEVLNIVAQSIADEGVTAMRVGEKGALTLPGYPTIPLGAELGASHLYGVGGSQLVENRTVKSNTTGEYAFASWQSNGAWTGIFGPNITSISVSVDTNGIQTTYSMKTYTPGFGKFAKSNADRLKKINKFQIYNQKRFLKKSATYVQGELNQEIRYGRPRRISTKDQGILSMVHTPHKMFAGTYIQRKDNISYPSAVTLSDADLYSELSGWYSKGMMSIDGLLRPIATKEHKYLSTLATPTNTGVQSNPKPVLHYVIKDGERIGSGVPNIKLSYTQPFQFKDQATVDYTGALDYCSGDAKDSGCHDVAMVAFGNTYPTGHDGQAHILSDYDGNIIEPLLNSGMRVMALKGPLLMQGWGYTTHNKPIPNFSDDEGKARSGIFSPHSDYFMDDFLRKSHTWPVGPVDLRWDLERSMWVSPPSYRLVNGILDNTMSTGTLYPDGSTTGLLRISLVGDEHELFDASGVEVNGDVFIVARDLLGHTPASGTKLVTMYDAYHKDYIVIKGPGGAGSALSYYLLLTDIDGETDTPLAFANPLEWDSTNLQWLPFYDHLDDEGYPIVDPEWTKILVDTTRSLGAWEDDFVTAQDLTETYTSYYQDKNKEWKLGVFNTVEFISRPSSQYTYIAYVDPEVVLYPQQAIYDCAVYINGLEKRRAIYDLGLIAAGNALISPFPDGMFVEVTYMQDIRKWCVTGAACERAVGL